MRRSFILFMFLVFLSSKLTYGFSLECGTSYGTCLISNPCYVDANCTAGYYCENASLFQCVACPAAPEDPGYYSGACPSPACIGYDPDCCKSDEDCTLAGNITGVAHFCEGGTCRRCTPVRDFFCPSPACIGYDPDCCKSDEDCTLGSTCVSGICIEKQTTCVSNLDCPSGFICIEGSCSSSSIITTSRQSVSFSIQKPQKLFLYIRNPYSSGKNAFITITSKEGRVFAEPNRINITVQPWETLPVTITLYGRKIGSDTLTIQGVLGSVNTTISVPADVLPPLLEGNTIVVAPTPIPIIYILLFSIILWMFNWERKS